MTELTPAHKIYYTGRRNVYACAACKKKIVTIDLVKGTTPFMMRCPYCAALGAQSSFYSVPQNLLPTAEWYKPDEAEYAKLDDGTKEHVDQGGLLVRPVPDETLRILRKVGPFTEDIPTVMVASVDLDKPQGQQIKTEDV